MPPPPAIAPTPEEETNRVSLVEFFTNAHYKKPGKEEGAIGGALGNEGVMTYFPREKVAMLTYHLLHPQLPLGFARQRVRGASRRILWSLPCGATCQWHRLLRR